MLRQNPDLVCQKPNSEEPISSDEAQDEDYLRSNRPKKIIKYYGKRRKYYLKRSFVRNNYLTDEETISLCKKTDLTKEQIQTWFCHKERHTICLIKTLLMLYWSKSEIFIVLKSEMR